jgi:ABC-type antimicrobial peptide transport system permease subunit
MVASVGFFVGCLVGFFVGFFVGLIVGFFVGSEVGLAKVPIKLSNKKIPRRNREIFNMVCRENKVSKIFDTIKFMHSE